MELRFTQAARRHRVGRGAVMEVVNATEPESAVTARGEDGLLWVGRDSRGRELEVLAVLLPTDPPTGLIIHVMPTASRRN